MAALDQDALQAELKLRRICRFCLSQDPSKISNIYMRDTRIKSSAPLPIQIMAIASIEVFSNDGMPSFLCTDCIGMFEYSYQFKQMCKRADNLLRQFPLTGKWPARLDKPILLHRVPPGPSKFTKSTQTRTQHSAKPGSQEPQLLNKKILNSSICSTQTGATASPIPKYSSHSEMSTKTIKVEKVEGDFSITLFDKIDNNDELSLDDIQQLVAAEDKYETEFITMDNLATVVVDSGHTIIKPKLLNQSSIGIPNKDAEPKNEPRLSLPKIKKDIDGEMQTVTEILNEDDKYKEEADPVETNVFPCNFCKRTFPLLKRRDIHMKKHIRDRKFQCEHCEKSFVFKCDLHRHSFTHNGRKPFICKICNKGFAFKHNLERHEVIHSRQQPFSCQYHAERRPYPCKFCKTSYLLSHHLTRHLRSHKNINDSLNAISFMCTRCNTSFDYLAGLISHSTSHISEQNLSCPLCKDVFNNMLELTSHIQYHSAGEACACEFCDLIFITAEKLQLHSNLEHSTEIEAYHADDRIQADIKRQSVQKKENLVDIADEKLQKTVNEVLGNEFSNESEEFLKNDIKKEEDVFNNMLELTSHIQDHSEVEAYACEFCDLIFITAEKLQLHLNLEHSTEAEAYHADDRIQTDIKKQIVLKKENLIDIEDEKLQKTVIAFLGDEFSNETEEFLKNDIKKEEESPKIINAADNSDDKNQVEQNSLLLPLKQRKIDVSGKSVVTLLKSPEQIRKTYQVKRKIPTVAETPVKRESNQPTIQSLLKLAKGCTVTKTPEAVPSKTPPSKAPPTKTPSTETSASKKDTAINSVPPSKIIQVEAETLLQPLSSKSLDKDGTEKKKTDTKNIKVQKITVTKAQAAAMAKEGRIKIKDGRIILKKSMSL